VCGTTYVNKKNEGNGRCGKRWARQYCQQEYGGEKQVAKKAGVYRRRRAGVSQGRWARVQW